MMDKTRIDIAAGFNPQGEFPTLSCGIHPAGRVSYPKGGMNPAEDNDQP